ncbi:40S ribosomal protein S3a [Spatholobus suberectus]|nr:40S ribosomal protein S3a [Spatholobus suberectus]
MVLNNLQWKLPYSLLHLSCIQDKYKDSSTSPQDQFLMIQQRLLQKDSNIVFEVSLADFQGDEDDAFRKIRMRAEDVQGRNVMTNFWGMDFNSDKLRSLMRKWKILIETHVDVKTTDNYTLRMFCFGFTKN